MQLPIIIRDSLVEDLDDMLEAYASDPDTEAVVSYLLEQLEILADEEGIDDVLAQLEDDASLEASLEAPLAELLEAEMASNDEFEFTGEEVVSLLERICEIEWENDEDDDWEDEDEDDLDEDDFEDDF